MSSKEYWQVPNTFNKKLEKRMDINTSSDYYCETFLKLYSFTLKLSLHIPLKADTK